MILKMMMDQENAVCFHPNDKSIIQYTVQKVVGIRGEMDGSRINCVLQVIPVVLTPFTASLEINSCRACTIS